MFVFTVVYRGKMRNFRTAGRARCGGPLGAPRLAVQRERPERNAKRPVWAASSRPREFPPVASDRADPDDGRDGRPAADAGIRGRVAAGERPPQGKAGERLEPENEA